MKFRRFAGVALFLLASQSLAQSYPTRAVTFIVPFAPGGGTDITARTVAARLTQLWKTQSVVVENRGGAGGVIGVDVVAKAKPDGHTLLIANVGTQSIPNPALSPRLARRLRAAGENHPGRSAGPPPPRPPSPGSPMLRAGCAISAMAKPRIADRVPLRRRSFEPMPPTRRDGAVNSTSSHGGHARDPRGESRAQMIPILIAAVGTPWAAGRSSPGMAGGHVTA